MQKLEKSLEFLANGAKEEGDSFVTSAQETVFNKVTPFLIGIDFWHKFQFFLR